MPHTDPSRSSDPAALARIEAALTGPGAPFAVARAEHGPLVYANGPRTLREFVETTWAFGDQPFLVSGERTVSYGDFFAAASSLARRLTGTYGLRPGERAVVAMRNRPEWQIAFWAVQLAGLVAVPLNTCWTEGEFGYALDDCEPAVLLVDAEQLPKVADRGRRSGARFVVFHGGEAVLSGGGGVLSGGEELPVRAEWYAALPEPDPSAAPPGVEIRPEDDATIIYTSGTTGRPRGAVATHLAQVGAALNPRYQAAASALGRGAVPGQGPAPVTLMTFPFFHVAAFTSLYAAMAVGGTLVLMPEWDAGEALRLIRRHGVSHYAGVPATALQLLAAADREGDGLEGLKGLDTGGAAPPALVTRLTARYGERIEPRNGYGLTETSGGVLADSGAAYRAYPDSVGTPTPVTEVRIAGPGGESLPDGEPGELWLRGQSLVRGYWRDEAATAEAFTGGWFRTGDLAVVRDGRVAVVDRIKDMVVRGGENVYCVEVEAALHEHPDVEDAAVLGVPHPVLGEEVAAVVLLRPGSAVTAETLRAHVGRSLAAFKVPAHVLVTRKPLPRNAAGKILERELRGALREYAGEGPGEGRGPGPRARGRGLTAG
ncbi:class I adenylate-forming enzyme family protein [Streptomyces sp. NPDC014623]|uniref:class I adenylate-forming enzyme family protein n=1 Tax=Streptomyces sp. NPDC014623 TaxID=3364875 RepID=UPI0036FF6061